MPGETPTSTGPGAGLTATSKIAVLIDDLLKWERSLAVATWEHKPIPADRYRRKRDEVRSELERAISGRAALSAKEGS